MLAITVHWVPAYITNKDKKIQNLRRAKKFGQLGGLPLYFQKLANDFSACVFKNA